MVAPESGSPDPAHRGFEHAESLQAGLAETQAEQQGSVEVKFIHARHFPENMKAIARAVGAAQWIAMEYVATAEQRADEEAQMNATTLGGRRGWGLGPLTGPFARALRGSGKRIFLIDVDEGNEKSEAEARADEYKARIAKDKYDVPTSEVCNLVRAAATADAKYDAYREQRVSEQLDPLFKQAREQGINNVAVVEGLVHQAPYEQMAARPDLQASQEFVTGNSLEGEEITTAPYQQLTRHYMRGEFVPEELVRRCAAEYYMRPVLPLKMNHRQPNYPPAIVTDDQVSTMLTSIDNILASTPDHYDRVIAVDAYTRRMVADIYAADR